MTFHVRSRHLIVYDALAIVVAYAVSFVMRFDTAYILEQLGLYWSFVLPMLAVTISALYRFGMYRRIWRYASTPEVAAVVGAVTLGSLVVALSIIPGLSWLSPTQASGFPRSVIAIDWMLTIGMIGGIRLLLRILSEAQGTRRAVNGNGGKSDTLVRTLVVGAGDAGALVVRELLSNGAFGLRPVGFVDDDERKHGLHIRGVPVLGNVASLPELIKDHSIGEVIIAMPTAGGRMIREIATVCRACGVVSKTVPGVFELISGAASIKQFRDVTISDLLRRDQVELPTERADALVRERIVAVTGAGGTIGAELCRQIATFRPSGLVLIDHDEFGLFELSTELRATHPSIWLALEVVDVKDRVRVEGAFAKHRPAVVFHAAARKHVAMVENNVHEAVATNVLGTMHVAQAAAHSGARHFVLISSDKAVRPPNVYGATKKVAEMVVQWMAVRHPDVAFATVRFGNVLGSRGSVVPIFQRQIAAGGPLTITDPDSTRFYMTVPEAVQLVLQAAAIAEGGELFVLDMGEPVRTGDLARDLVELSGLQFGRDIEIEIVGLRPGEKLHEELVAPSERTSPTAVDKVLWLQRQPVDELQIRRHIAAFEALLASASDEEAIRAALAAAAPESRLLEGEKAAAATGAAPFGGVSRR